MTQVYMLVEKGYGWNGCISDEVIAIVAGPPNANLDEMRLESGYTFALRKFAEWLGEQDGWELIQYIPFVVFVE